MVIPKTLQLVMLNLFQQLDPKIRFALKNKNPLIAAKSRPWSFVPDHGPVLRKSSCKMPVPSCKPKNSENRD